MSLFADVDNLCGPCDSTIIRLIDSLCSNKQVKDSKSKKKTINRKIIKKQNKELSPIHIIQIQQNCCPANDSNKSIKVQKKDHIKFKYQYILDFIIKISWQLLVLILFMRYGKQIPNLISSLKKMKVGNFDFEFNQELNKIEEESEKNESLSDNFLNNNQVIKNLEKLAKLSPRSCIIESWRILENTLRKGSKQFKVEERSPIRFIEKVLTGEGKLEKSQVIIIDKLMKLRNEAAHAPEFEITYDSAYNYARLTLSLSNILEKQFNDKR